MMFHSFVQARKKAERHKLSLIPICFLRRFLCSEEARDHWLQTPDYAVSTAHSKLPFVCTVSVFQSKVIANEVTKMANIYGQGISTSDK